MRMLSLVVWMGLGILLSPAVGLAQEAAPLSADPSPTMQWSGPIIDVDGRVGPQYGGGSTRDVQIRRRPGSPDDRTLVLENYFVHDVANQKGIDIGATVNPDGSIWGYESITVRHYEAARINRDEAAFGGIHIDGLRISGGNPQGKPTDVLIEDVLIHDGDALPLMIQDGDFGVVRLRNVRLMNTSLGAIQISTKNAGSIGKIIIEDSPGLRVAIMEGGETIGDIDVVNSPGAAYRTWSYAPRTFDGIAAVPEPAALALAAMGAVVALWRRRR